jgi:hypothetical protein
MENAMRYSKESKSKAVVLPTGKHEHHDFFTRAMQQSSAEASDIALILIGGCDHRSLALRRAQSVLRFDRRPSLWSHAAILFELDPTQAGDSRGVEVTLDPFDPTTQVPERNAVTEFTLSRYYDARRYPNVAFVRVSFVASESVDQAKPRAKKAVRAQPEPDPKQRIIKKLSEPSSDPQRYPLWNSLGVWARYTYMPELVPNPLLDNVFMPCAALCEFGFEAAEIDLTPGASANNSCPELIWSTVTHWQQSLASQIKLSVYVSKGNEAATPPEALPLTLPLTNR